MEVTAYQMAEGIYKPQRTQRLTEKKLLGFSSVELCVLCG
jgi:hypothetical protein